MDNLEYIIEKPDRVFYTKGYDEVKDKSTGKTIKVERYTLEYYKNLDGDVTVRVRVDSGRELKVKTVFPVNDVKVLNKARKELYNQYVITEEEYNERNKL